MKRWHPDSIGEGTFSGDWGLTDHQIGIPWKSIKRMLETLRFGRN